MKWIDLKQELPPLDEFVLLFDGSDYQVGKRVDPSENPGEIGWKKDYYFNFCRNCCWSFDKPTHWVRFDNVDESEGEDCCSCPWHNEDESCCKIGPFRGCKCLTKEIESISGVSSELMGLTEE